MAEPPQKPEGVIPGQLGPDQPDPTGDSLAIKPAATPSVQPYTPLHKGVSFEQMLRGERANQFHQRQFENAFNKHKGNVTPEEWKFESQKIADQLRKKEQDFFIFGKDLPHMAKEMARGVPLGLNNLGYSVVDLGMSIGGKTRISEWKDTNWALDDPKLGGPPETLMGALFSGGAQFLVPFWGAGKGWQGIKGFRAGRALKKGDTAKYKSLMEPNRNTAFSRRVWAIAGGGIGKGIIADFVAWDPEQGNIANALLKHMETTESGKWAAQGSLHGLIPWLKDWIALDGTDFIEGPKTRIDQFKARFMQIGEGAGMGVAFNFMFWGLKFQYLRGLKNYQFGVREATGEALEAGAKSGMDVTDPKAWKKLVDDHVKNDTKILKTLSKIHNEGWEVAPAFAKLKSQMDFYPVVQPDLIIRVDDLRLDPDGFTIEIDTKSKTKADDYDTWLKREEDELEIKAAETGADREADFDFEVFAEREYNKYAASIGTEPPKTKVDDYDTWLKREEDELGIKAAETGADREADFDFEVFAEREYNKYAASTKLKQGEKGAEDPTRGNVYARDFKKLGVTDTVLVRSNGTDIIIDPAQIKADYESGMPYMRGGGDGLDGSPIGRYSQNEASIANYMGLDITALREAFEATGDGVKAYTKFLVARQKRYLSELTRMGFDPANKKIWDNIGGNIPSEKINVNSIHDQQIRHLLSGASYDALVKDLGLDPKKLSNINFGPEITRSGTPEGQPILASTLFKRADAAGKGGAAEELAKIFKDIADPSSPMNFAALADIIRSKRLINLIDSSGNPMRADQVLLEIHKVMREGHKVYAGKKFPANAEAVAQAWGFVPSKSQGTPMEWIDEYLSNAIDEFSKSVGADFGAMDQLLRRGEGIFQGKTSDLNFGIWKEGDYAKKFEKLSLKQKLDVQVRLLAAQATMVEFDALRATAWEKYQAKKQEEFKPLDADTRLRHGEEVTLQDHLALLETYENLEIFYDGLRDTRRSAGLIYEFSRTFNNLKARKMLDGKELAALERARLEAFSYGNKTGIEALEAAGEALQVIREANGGTATASEKARMTAKHFQDADIINFATDYMVNAMLTGIGTQVVNNTSNMVRVFALAGSRFMGTYKPLPKSVSISKGLGRGVSKHPTPSVSNDDIMGGFLSGDQMKVRARVQSLRTAVATFQQMYQVIRYISRGGQPWKFDPKEQSRWITRADTKKAGEGVAAAQDTLEDTLSGGGRENTALAELATGAYKGDASDLLAGVSAAFPTFGKPLGMLAKGERGGTTDDFALWLAESKWGRMGMDGWDYAYNGTIRRGIRGLFGGDQAWKQAAAIGEAKGFLQAHAMTVKGLKDSVAIDAWVGPRAHGLIRNNGRLFSPEALRAEGMEIAAKKYQNSGESKEWLEQAVEHDVAVYIRNNWDLYNNGELIMTGDQRFALAQEMKRSAEEITYSMKLTEDFLKQRQLRTKAGEDVPDRKLFEYGNFGQLLSRASRDQAIIRIMQPFVKIPTNIMRDVGRHQPLFKKMQHRYIADMLSGDPAKMYAANGRQLVGTMVFGGALTLAHMGMMNGRGPTDKNERRAWLDQRNQPNSFVVPFTGHQVKFDRMEPASHFFGIGADLVENMHYARTVEESQAFYQFAEAAAAGVGEGMLEGTFLKDTTQLIDLMFSLSMEEGEATEQVERFIRKKGRTLVPAIWKEVGPNRMDKIEREIRGSLDALESAIWRYGKPPKRHRIFGTIIDKSEENFGRLWQVVGSFAKIHKPASDTPYERELISLGANMDPLEDTEEGHHILRKTEHYAITEKKIDIQDDWSASKKAWATKKMKQDTLELKTLARTFRAPGGELCTIELDRHQDLYDFTMKYISKRKIRPEWRGLANAMRRTLGTEKEPNEEHPEFSKKEFDSLRKWIDDVESYGWEKRKPMTLPEVIMATMSLQSYRDIDPNPDTWSDQKSLRLQFLTEIVSNWRRESVNEILYGNKKGQMVNIADVLKGEPESIGVEGIAATFWPKYTNKLSFIKNAEVLYNAQPNKGAVLKGFETQPLDQPGAIRDQKIKDAMQRLEENK